MNKILKLFDDDYVMQYLAERILPHYPDFTGIKSFKRHAYKKHIWEETYHVVIEYKTRFITREGKIKTLPIFCSAHSDEPRKNVYDALRYLWENGFNRGNLSIPHALYYDEYFQGTFYRGVAGQNLYYYIRASILEEVESIIPQAARWFAKLHGLPTENARNFNEENSRIETVFPGIDHLLARIKQDYPDIYEPYREIYKIVNNKEKEFLDTTDQRWLVHGDAHPENIIRMSPRKVAVIDFTDLCLSDFARDLGTFLQQLEFMCRRKVQEEGFSERMKNLFLEEYFKKSKVQMSDSAQRRIDNYYYWTAMRTATYFYIKDKREPGRGEPILRDICKKLNINI